MNLPKIVQELVRNVKQHAFIVYVNNQLKREKVSKKSKSKAKTEEVEEAGISEAEAEPPKGSIPCPTCGNHTQSVAYKWDRSGSKAVKKDLFACGNCKTVRFANGEEVPRLFRAITENIESELNIADVEFK